MKIGIISINIHTKSLNFACPLHTYAFQQFLFQHGIDNTVIDYRPIYDDNYNARYPLFHYLDRGFGGSFVPEEWLEAQGIPEERAELDRKFKLRREFVRHWVDLFYEREIRFDKFQEFIDDHYVKTDREYTHESLEYDDPGLDCYICVTDVIWQYNSGYGFDRGFFLASETMKGKGKIAYAASRGPWSGWSKEKEKEFKQYIEDIDYISVREPSLKEHIESISDQKAELVLDPVFLQDKEFYHNLAIPPREKKYVLLYDVMEKATDSVIHAARFAQAHGLQLIELSDRLENAFLPEGTWHEVRYDVGIEEWLGYIEHAEYVFTNSFHACCFSIIFEKEFFAGKRNGDKVDTVLDTFGLSWRRLNMEDDILQDLKRIDYASVKTVLEQKRKESEEFILNAIDAVEQKRKAMASSAGDFSAEQTAEDGRNPAETARAALSPSGADITYCIYYHSGGGANQISSDYPETDGHVVRTPKGALEYQCDEPVVNGAPIRLKSNCFIREGYQFNGWNARFTIQQWTFWYCTDGRFHESGEVSNGRLQKKLFHDCETIYYLPFKGELGEAALVMEATWKKSGSVSGSSADGSEAEKAEYRIYYHSGLAVAGLSHNYQKANGSVVRTQKGALEYRCTIQVRNGVPFRLRNNWFTAEGYQFCGWAGRVTVGDETFWYCTDCRFHTTKEIVLNPRLQKHLFVNREMISWLPVRAEWGVITLVMEAEWKRFQYKGDPAASGDLPQVKAGCHIYYHSGAEATEVACGYHETENAKVIRTPKGAWECQCMEWLEAGTSVKLKWNHFTREGYLFNGWNGRVTVKHEAFWYCNDGRFHTAKEISSNRELQKYVFRNGEEIASLPLNEDWGKVALVMEATWKPEQMKDYLSQTIDSIKRKKMKEVQRKKKK